MMTTAEANARLNTVADPLIPPDRPVWVVTVKGDRTMSGPPGSLPTVYHVYTSIYDAPAGQIILDAVGIDGLHVAS